MLGYLTELSLCFIELLSLHFCTQAISRAQDAHAYVHMCIYLTHMLLICRWFTCMSCCSIFMPVLLSGCYMPQTAFIIVDIENTRRKTVKPFRLGVFSSAKGLKYILFVNNFWDDQQVGKLPFNEFLGRVNSIAMGCSDRLGHAKNTNPGLTPQ